MGKYSKDLRLAKALAEFNTVLLANIGKPVGLTLVGAFAALMGVVMEVVSEK